MNICAWVWVCTYTCVYNVYLISLWYTHTHRHIICLMYYLTFVYYLRIALGVKYSVRQKRKIDFFFERETNYTIRERIKCITGITIWMITWVVNCFSTNACKLNLLIVNFLKKLNFQSAIVLKYMVLRYLWYLSVPWYYGTWFTKYIVYTCI